MKDFQRNIFLGIFAFFLASSAQILAAKEPVYPAAEKPAKRFFVGEKLTYKISYFGVPVGRAEAEVKEITEIQGRKAYHIVVSVRSTTVVDLIHRVRGTHHSYIDVENLYSLRYESFNRPDPAAGPHMILQFDHAAGKVNYSYPFLKRQKDFPILPRSQDRLSLPYVFRTLDAQPGGEYFIPTSTEQKNFNIRVQTLKVQEKVIKNVGRFQALEAIPELTFVTRLSKPGSVRGWVSMDERRIPLELIAKAPLAGFVHVKLTSYQPGKDA